ncbi:MAG TPA: NERD domain-containing protein [Clostridiales bacterium]|nr:NERD domain-containing protein [Clostridiales bacterium]
MGKLIVDLIIVIIVLIIAKNNNKKDSNTDLYKEIKRNHEELKKSKSQKANKSKSKRVSRLSKPSKPKKKAKEDKYSLRPQEKASKTKHKKFSNEAKVNREEWQAKQAEADKKGELGEQKIVDTLEYLDFYGKTLSNVYVPKSNGRGTAEIDVIYINQYGVYVIESKNHNGSIYGDDKYDKWVVYYRKARDGSENKFHFYSPVKQNEAHIEHLSKKLSTIDKKDLHSIIVFIEPFNMKVNSKSDVVMLKDLNSLINKYESGEDTVFSRKEVDKIYNLLKPYTDVSDKVKKAHLRQANRAKRYSNRKYFSK